MEWGKKTHFEWGKFKMEDSKVQGIDVNEFLEFYLLDSTEQIDKFGSGLLLLEKDTSNIELVNDLFRSAHSLKGASGTMGFTPIVTLTHMAEDLLDKIRQGSIKIDNDGIDVLLSVTDRIKTMLTQVENNQEIRVPVDDLVEPLQKLINGVASEVLNEPVTQATEATKINFDLTEDEEKQIADAVHGAHGVYQADVVFAKGTLMKAVRIIITVQRLEKIATVIKTVPSSEEVELQDAEFFSVLFITDEPVVEIQREIEGISEITSATIRVYQPEHNDTLEVSEILPTESLTPAELAKIAEISKGTITVTELLEPQVDQVATPKAESSPVVPKVEINTVVPKSGAIAPVEEKHPKSNQQVKQASNSDGGNQVNTIRVDTARLDSLINLVGELVITRIRLVQIGSDLKEQGKKDSLGLVDNLNETTMYLGRLMGELQEGVMHLRMVPISTVFNRFPRLVRDLSRKTEKEIDLVVNGEDTELDKNVVEVIGDPIMHLIRNSVDHGIEHPQERIESGKPEVGTISLDAYHEGNNIVIVISDDGAGLDLPKIRKKGIEKGLISEEDELTDKEIANLIFLPGFSTAEQVTDISGRGVGMDVVKKAINNLGGMIDTVTKKGEGTTFTIRLPLTLAIIQALMVGVGNETYAVPLSSVLETLILDSQEVKTISGSPVITLRDFTLPLIYLKDRFTVPDTPRETQELYVIVVNFGDKKLGLVVDELRGQQEIVIKTLGSMLSNLAGVAGATILGDGKVTLILDIGAIIQEIFNLT